MRIHLMAAAIRQVIAPPIQAVDQRNFWDNTVSQLVVDEGVIRDLKRAGYTSRVGNLGTGPFSKQSIQFNTTSQVRYGSSPFSLYGNFTIEGHVNFDSAGFATNTNQYIFDIGTNNFVFRLYNKKWHLSAPANTTLQLNRWYHVALTRYNGLCTLWIDGKAVATYTYGTALFAGTAAVNIGADSNGNFQFGGQINSVRITRNNARYSNNFSPKRVKELGHVTGDSVDFDAYYCRTSAMFELATELQSGLRQLQIATQRSTSQLDATRLLHGKPTLTLTSGANGGINYNSFNRALLVAGDCTVEAWVNTDYSGAATVLPIIGQYHATTSGAWILGVYDRKAYFFIRGGINVAGTTIIADGNWHHVAVVIRSGVAYLYIDGVREGNTPNVGSVWPSYIGAIQLGMNIASEAPAGARMNIGRVRTTHGKARYTANFTPSEKTVQTLSMAA